MVLGMGPGGVVTQRLTPGVWSSKSHWTLYDLYV